MYKIQTLVLLFKSIEKLNNKKFKKKKNVEYFHYVSTCTTEETLQIRNILGFFEKKNSGR